MAMMAMLCLTFSSCSDDDDEKSGNSELSGYYSHYSFIDAVKNNEFDEDGSSWYSTVFIHFIDNNTIERGMIYAHKKPQSNAAFSKNIGGTTLYFVVDYLDWVCKYTYKNGALYISNGDIYTFNNGFFYTGDGIKFKKI